MTSEKICLGTFSVTIANRYRDLLNAQNVELAIIHNKATCSSGGCGTSMELWANQSDLPVVIPFLQQEQARNYIGLDINPELLNQVFDTSQENAICPACGTEFSTSSSECPDCGLGFQIPG